MNCKEKIKKPEKKELKKDDDGWNLPYQDKQVGYNQACDEWETFLPNETEILRILCGGCGASCRSFETGWCANYDEKNIIAKAITKRIRDILNE